MDTKEVRESMTRPQVQRLKDLGMGLKVGKVLGSRVLVKPIQPFTEMDRVEKAGLLYAPKSVKDANTPLPTTGIVLQLGPLLLPNCGVEEGDAVMFSRYAGMDIVVDQGDFKLLQIEEIACTLEMTKDALEVTTE